MEYVATMSSPFRVRDLDAFLGDPAIIAWRAYFEEIVEDDGDCDGDSESGARGRFEFKPLADAGGEVSVWGFCRMPRGGGWQEAIRQHIVPGQRMRITTCGFDRELRYTIAVAYDIDWESVIPVDASYGRTAKGEWFCFLPEVQDPRNRDYSGLVTPRLVSPGEHGVSANQVLEDMAVATLASRFRVRDAEAFGRHPGNEALRLNFLYGLEPSDLADDPELKLEDYLQKGYFEVERLASGEAEVSMGGFYGMRRGQEWREAIRDCIVPGQRMRVSMAGFEPDFKYLFGGAYDIDCESITPIDVTYGCVVGPGRFFTILPEVSDPRQDFSRFHM